MDENELAGRQISKQRVLGSSVILMTSVSEVESTNWTTILEVITGDGRWLTPVMVLEGESLQKQWFPANLPDYKFIYS